MDVSFFCLLQFTPRGSLKCVGISALETIHIIWCLSCFVYAEKLRCPFPCCPWISAVCAFCCWWKLFFLWSTQPVVLLWTAFSSSPVAWVSQEMPADHGKRLRSAEQIPFRHSGLGISWKWLCVTPTSEQLLHTVALSCFPNPTGQQLLRAPWFSVTRHLLPSDAQGLACLPAFPKLGNGL